MEAVKNLDASFQASSINNTQNTRKIESQNDNDTSSGSGGGEDAVYVNIRRGLRDEPSAYSLASSLKERINTHQAEAVAAQPVPSEQVVSALTES